MRRLILLPTFALVCALAGCGDATPPDTDVGDVVGAPLDAVAASLGDLDDGSLAEPSEPEIAPEPVVAAEPQDPPDAEPKPPEEPEAPVDDGEPLSLSWDVLASFDCEMPEVALFPEEGEETDEKEEELPPIVIPDDVQKLRGRTIMVEGYMLPLEWNDDGSMRSFLLSRHGMGCCYGVAPKANEMIEVTMKEGVFAQYEQYLPVVLTGRLQMHSKGVRAEYLQCIYTMEGEAVALVEKVR